VDPETGDPLPDGEEGELVLSAPTKEAFPVLRYRTRDLTRLTREPCPCGRTGARISRITGRTDDMLIIRGINVFPSQIEHALLGIDGLEPHYQLVLSTREDHQDGLLVRVEMAKHVAEDSSAYAALENHVLETLRNALGLSATIELASPHTVPRSEGKAVRVLDERTDAG
jgi:phenylacetate-CoA ligase